MLHKFLLIRSVALFLSNAVTIECCLQQVRRAPRSERFQAKAWF